MNIHATKKVTVKNQKIKLFPRWTIWLFGTLSLVIGIWIGMTISNNNNLLNPDDTFVVFQTSTFEVAKQFSCSCGGCGEENLAICECPTAISTKKFIEMNLNGGMKKEEVVGLVKDVYGHHRG